MNPVDKAKVRRAFGRAAPAYDEGAAVQRRVRERLLALALARVPAPAPLRALDVGAGTGALLAALGQARPRARLAGVDLARGMVEAARARAPGAALAVGDAEALPLADARFDLVVSTSALQWLPRLEPSFRELRRVLAPGGLLAVALFGGETLRELTGAWRDALPPGAADRTHRFHAPRAVEAAAEAAGLRLEHAQVERHVERHASPLAVLRALRRIGAANAAPVAGPGASGLGARGAVLRMCALYGRRHGDAGGVPATWDVVYALARAPAR